MSNMKKLSLSVVALLFATACINELSTTNDSPFSYGEAVCRIQPPTLDEISGMVESDAYPDHFWVHNDSGDAPNVYLINLRGELVATVELVAESIDWEDIAIHRGQIYVGEIGDNNSVHPHKRIYRIDEPQIDTLQRGVKIKIDSLEQMQFNFADTKRDCETLMVDPISGDLVLLTKREDRVFIYQTPFIATQHSGEEVLIPRGAQIAIGEATGGDISRDGSHIVVKNYDNIYYYTRNVECETISEALTKEPTVLAYRREPQGEAIAWSHDATKFYTISEKSRRTNDMPDIYCYISVH